MDKEFIDLGHSYEDMLMEGKEPKKHYPTLCITSDEPLEFPEGDFKFSAVGRLVEVNANERDPDDKKFRYEIQVNGMAPGESVESEDEDEEEVIAVVSRKDPVDELERAMKG